MYELMMAYFTFAACIFGLTAFNYYAGRKNVLYPPFIFSLIWLGVFVLYLLSPIELEKLEAYTLIVVISGAIAFSTGGMLVRPPRGIGSLGTRTISNSTAKKAIFFCCLGILPLFFLEIQRLSSVGGLDSFMISARTAIVDAVVGGEKPFSSSIYTVAPLLAIFSAFIFLIEMRDWRREWIWVCSSILMAGAFSILTTGRTWLLELIVGLSGIYLLKDRRFSPKDAWKSIRWPLLVILALFSILVPLNKDISSVDGGTTEVLAEFVVGYAVIPLAGFDYVVHHPAEYKYDSNHTFKQILPALARISGFEYSPPPTVDDFVWVPLPTNVYTVFKYYYVDFGLFGMLVTMFFFGAGQTWLFGRALTGSHFYIFLFAISLYPLMMIAFDDAYSMILNNLVALVFAVLYFQILRKIPSRKSVKGDQESFGQRHYSSDF
jgi:oligosaccharide repeat unit polymerase